MGPTYQHQLTVIDETNRYDSMRLEQQPQLELGAVPDNTEPNVQSVKLRQIEMKTR